jgi:hypothetical protein
MGQDAAGRIAHFETMSMAEGRYAQSGEAIRWLKKSWPRISRIHTNQETKKIRLFRVDSRSVFFGHIDFTDYIDFADTAEFKGKQKVPHSYSRALKKTRASLNRVRDDGTN